MPKRTLRRAVAARKARRRRRAPIEMALAGLAHDIRTPLNAIAVMAELLQSADLPARERLWVDAIKDSADHLALLTTVVVDAARAGSTGLVLRAEPFSPRALARTVAASLAARAEGKGLAVRVSIARSLPRRLVGDAVRLRGALENLIDNAVKFTERGGIGLSVTAAGAGRGRTRLTFAVTDSGIGMAAADLKRLFRPFAQASDEVARHYGGSGLGLLLAKRIAEAMEGSLTVTSSPGRGSTFTLSVVAEDASLAPPVRRASPAR